MDNSKEFQLMLNKAIISEPFAFVDFDRTKNVQDQLQEIMLNHWNFKSTLRLLHEFTHWVDAGGYGKYENSSMEQLWLAFVMKEKYNKLWNGDKWVNSDMV